MAIKVVCGDCGARIDAPDDSAGRSIVCVCGNTVDVPAPGAPAAMLAPAGALSSRSRSWLPLLLVAAAVAVAAAVGLRFWAGGEPVLGRWASSSGEYVYEFQPGGLLVRDIDVERLVRRSGSPDPETADHRREELGAARRQLRQQRATWVHAGDLYLTAAPGSGQACFRLQGAKLVACDRKGRPLPETPDSPVVFTRAE